MPIVDYESALEFLLGRVNYETFRQMPYVEMQRNLDRLKAFLAFLGRPDRRFPLVHVAGTKGKGSTCTMIDAVFRKAGYRVGRFTSPHLHSLNERFAVDDRPIPDDRLVETLQYLESQWHAWENAADRELTFFEWSIVLAFEYFARENVDLAVIETGIGGRFDATNVCEPALCVITSISFEHVEQLGDTLAAIAGEKAGIIKPGVPVVSGVAPCETDDLCETDDPRAVIREVAAKNHAPLYEKNRDFSITPHHDGRFDFDCQLDGGNKLLQLQLALPGRHQRDNAALAIVAVIQLRERGFDVPDDAIRAALAEIEVPGRVERITLRHWPGNSPPVLIVDGAHNRASAEALRDALTAMYEPRQRADAAPGRKILLFGSTLGKDVHGMFETLFPLFDEVWLSRYSTSPRACPIETLRETANASTCKAPKIVVFAGISEALDALQHSTGANDLVCVTGSMYFAAEVRERLLF